jgi:hypothetical protein
MIGIHTQKNDMIDTFLFIRLLNPMEIEFTNKRIITSICLDSQNVCKRK